MYIKQIYTNCLAQATYYIESEGEAAIIDPLRDPQPYIELLNYRQAKLKYVFETHFHADFVSGHIDLAHLTGAVIVFGPCATPNYEALVAFDRERFRLGQITIEVLHTPGHTIESACFLARNADNEPTDLFTGDTLFVDDVGRPDLLSGNTGKEELASMLYDSLHQKILSLPDKVIVYPGHGAGSACGRNIGKDGVTTIGEQRQSNYALKEQYRTAFVKAVTSALPAVPPYFFKASVINRQGPSSYTRLIAGMTKALSVARFKLKLSSGCRVLDTREASVFAKGFIPGALNIGLNGDYAIWVGTLMPFDKDILLVTEEGREEESIMRLARIGYDRIKGFLKGGMESWINEGEETAFIPVISVREAESRMAKKNPILLDVRTATENAGCKLKNSTCLPLQVLSGAIPSLDKSRPYIVYCAGGYRSMIACSMLRAQGIREVFNIEGGINKVKAEQHALVEYAS